LRFRRLINVALELAADTIGRLLLAIGHGGDPAVFLPVWESVDVVIVFLTSNGSDGGGGETIIFLRPSCRRRGRIGHHELQQSLLRDIVEVRHGDD